LGKFSAESDIFFGNRVGGNLKHWRICIIASWGMDASEHRAYVAYQNNAKSKALGL